MALEQSQHQLVWRLIDETGQGADVVTLVLPVTPEKTDQPQLLETDVVASAPLTLKPLTDCDLTWSETDLQLLFTLVIKMLDLDDDADDRITLDFDDPTVIEIVQVVAAARFAQPHDLTNHHFGPEVYTELNELEQGDLVAVQGESDFPLMIIVELDSVEATCVLMEPLALDTGLAMEIHEVVKLSRLDLLPATFGHVYPGEEDLVH